MPNSLHILVGFFYRLIEIGTVSVAMAHIIGVLQINPRKVGAVFFYITGGFLSDMLIDGADVGGFSSVWKVDFIVFKTVEMVIEAWVASDFLSVADQFGSVVEPG